MTKEDHRPTYYMWVYDPHEGHVFVEHNDDKLAVNEIDHKDIAPHVHHPEKIEGYALPIEDGWRISDKENHEVKDRFVLKRVLAALRHEHPPPLLPSIRPHGNPRA